MIELFNELNRYPDAGLFILRFMLAVIFLYHGAPKLFGAHRGQFVAMLQSQGFPMPTLLGLLAGLAEFAGGLALLAGVWVGPAASFIAINMLVATWLKVAKWNKGFGGDNGYEYDLMLLAGLLALVFLGPGGWRLL